MRQVPYGGLQPNQYLAGTAVMLVIGTQFGPGEAARQKRGDGEPGGGDDEAEGVGLVRLPDLADAAAQPQHHRAADQHPQRPDQRHDRIRRQVFLWLDGVRQRR